MELPSSFICKIFIDPVLNYSFFCFTGKSVSLVIFFSLQDGMWLEIEGILLGF